MKAIATINFKGGVGKTTLTWLLAQLAARSGTRTLVVDADAQGSLTTALTVDERGGYVPRFGPWYETHMKSKRTLLNALEAYDSYARGKDAHFDFPVDGRFVYQVSKDLHFIPSTDDLYWLELEVFQPESVKGFINALLGRLEHSFPAEVVFFDCPPSFTLLSYSILSNCSLVLVPVNPDVFAARGLGIMVEGLRSRVQPWPKPEISVFMNKARGRYSGGSFSPFNETFIFRQAVDREAQRLTAQGTSVELFKTLVPERAGIRQAISFGGFPREFEPEFARLWDEIKGTLHL